MVPAASTAPYNRRVQWQQFNSLLRLTARELWRTQWAWLVPGLCILAWGLAEFVASLAITESAAFRITCYAASVRLALVAVTALVVITGTVRDGDDRVLELFLSRPLDRRLWVGAKFCAFALAALAAAAVAGLPLWAWCPGPAAAAWSLTLGCELVLIAAAALTAALSLAQVTFAGLAVAGFYLLGRSLQAAVWLSQDPIFELTATSHRALAFAVRGLSHLLPDFDRFAATAWLLYDAPTRTDLGVVLIQTALYGAVLVLAGMLDFQRRSL